MELRGFVTVVAAAKIAGVHRSTIYSWLEQNKIENSRLGGARYILRTSLEQFLGPLLASA
jgi:excisionase family DNA binding protein